MKCKFCFAELEEDMMLCPACGKEQTEEVVETVPEETVETTPEEVVEAAPAKKKSKAWKIVLAVAGVIAVAVILAGAIIYSMGLADEVAYKFETMFHNLNPWRENDIDYRLDYTVKDSVAEKKHNEVVATLGDQELTNGELQAYYWSGVFYFVNKYYVYLEDMGLDVNKPLNEQIAIESSGQTFQQMFLLDAIENWRTYAILTELGEAAGHTITAEQQKYLDELEMEKIPGMTEENFYEYNRMSIYALSYYDTLYQTMMPTAEQLEQYYKDNEATLVSKGFGKDNGNYYAVRHILIEVEATGEGKTLTDEDWAKCKAEAQKVLDEYLAGEKTESSFATLANKYSADPGSNTNGGLYENLTKSTSFVEPFKNWYLDASRQVGDVELVQTDYGYHVMYFSDCTPIWEYEVNAAVLTENTTKFMEDLKKQYTLDVDYTKIALGYMNILEE